MSTAHGISVDLSDDYDNADDWIRIVRDRDSHDIGPIAPRPLKWFVDNVVFY
jgi:hypothetical protein